MYEVGMSKIENLDINFLDSYIRLVYERYSFVQNLNNDVNKHPDIEFFDFIRSKFFERSKLIKIETKDLPSYDYQDNVQIKKYHLLQLIDIISRDETPAIVEVGRYLVKKIISQDSRRHEFNFAKLKTVQTALVAEDFDEIPANDDELDEEEEDVFMSYDIDMDDMEDNIDGDID